MGGGGKKACPILWLASVADAYKSSDGTGPNSNADKTILISAVVGGVSKGLEKNRG
jgi:hypothetical protein